MYVCRCKIKPSIYCHVVLCDLYFKCHLPPYACFSVNFIYEYIYTHKHLCVYIYICIAIYIYIYLNLSTSIFNLSTSIGAVTVSTHSGQLVMSDKV